MEFSRKKRKFRDFRTVKRFAWFPVKISTTYNDAHLVETTYIWLEWYIAHQEWYGQFPWATIERQRVKDFEVDH
jgi:hypothetical protein